MGKKLTTQEFIERARIVHGDKYDYSKVNYVNSTTKICIICPIHGEFLQRPNDHLNGKGCPKCSGNVRGTKEEFISKSNIIHQGRYDYSKVTYIDAHTKVCIICHEHGEFWQTPNVHLIGCGCPKCGNDKSAVNQRLGLENFLNRARIVHGDKYDYSKVNYVNFETKVCIICPKHGEFYQLPYEHLIGKGCVKCGHEKVSEKKSMKYHDFVDRANKVHKNKYLYSKDTFVNASVKTLITCPKHGEFWQTPDHHLNGNGCPYCNESKLEKYITKLLDDNGIIFKRQFRSNWLGRQSLDFYLPDYNVGIECQGVQHYKPTSFGSKTKTKEECFELITKRDNQKRKLCEERGIKLLYFSNVKYENNVITDGNNLLEKIQHNDI